MKYLSEITNKAYDSIEALEKAEAEVTTAKNERAIAAKEVEKAMATAREAQKAANEKLENFCKKYGSFKTTLKSADTFDPFDWIFKLL